MPKWTVTAPDGTTYPDVEAPTEAEAVARILDRSRGGTYPVSTGPASTPLRQIAEGLLPSTPEGLALDIASLATGFGPVGRAIDALGRGWRLLGPTVRVGARLGIPTAAATGTAAITGRDPGAAAEMALLSGAFGEALGLAGRGLQRGVALYRGRRTPGGMSARAARMGPAFADAVAHDIELIGRARRHGAVFTVEDLFDLAAGEGIGRIPHQAFDRLDELLVQTMATGRVHVPYGAVQAAAPLIKDPTAFSRAFLDATRTAASTHPLDMAPLPISDALKVIRVLKENARRVGRSNPERGTILAAAANQTEASVLTDVQNVSRPLADLYRWMMHQYRKFVALRDVLEGSKEKIFPVGKGTLGFDPAELIAALRAAAADVPPSEFPHLWRFAEMTAGPYAGPWKAADPHARMYAPRLGPMHFGFRIPGTGGIHFPPGSPYEGFARRLPGLGRTAGTVLSVPFLETPGPPRSPAGAPPEEPPRRWDPRTGKVYELRGGRVVEVTR